MDGDTKQTEETPKEPLEKTEQAAAAPEPAPEQPPVAQDAATEQSETPDAPAVIPAQSLPIVGSHGHKKAVKKVWLLVFVALLVLAAAAGLGWWLGHNSAVQTPDSYSTQSKSQNKNSTQSKPASTANSSVPGLKLDTGKNYGNKYADGVLPVGDGKYTTSAPKAGYGYVCSQYAHNLETQAGGAGRPGPWFMNNDTEYNINKKVQVKGSVSWHGTFSDTVSGSARTITGNDLPLAGTTTGVFPIMRTDPAYAYDKNPNTITAQSFTYSLAANPSYGVTPHCIGGQVGVMNNGVALFSAFDAGGRDAGAWETQDSCDGHPQSDGIYHYHTLSSCIKDVSVHDVIGFALDGFPITGPDVGKNNVLTTSDLDECHGITSQITLDGKSVTMYHYVMTQDFPYSVSCYRATPITPPGQGLPKAQHP